MLLMMKILMSLEDIISELIFDLKFMEIMLKLVGKNLNLKDKFCSK
jgi:hypothetical protein